MNIQRHAYFHAGNSDLYSYIPTAVLQYGSVDNKCFVKIAYNECLFSPPTVEWHRTIFSTRIGKTKGMKNIGVPHLTRPNLAGGGGSAGTTSFFSNRSSKITAHYTSGVLIVVFSLAHTPPYAPEVRGNTNKTFVYYCAKFLKVQDVLQIRSIKIVDN